MIKTLLSRFLGNIVDETQANQYALQTIASAVGTRPPKISAGLVPDKYPTDADHEYALRLLEAYEKCSADEPASDTEQVDLWSSIRATQGSFFEVLHSGKSHRLAEYLCNICRQDATTGTVQGDAEFTKLSADVAYREYIGLMIKDKLVLLAEAVGAIACENPEQGPWGENLHRSVNSLVESIEAALSMDISPPEIDGGLLKIRSSNGLFHERDFNAIYTAWCLSQILPPTDQTAICEIGAGSGRVAHWASRFGYSSYVAIDLPQINVIQGYYLLKSLGPNRVALYGESTNQPETGKFKVLPYFCTRNIEPDAFDLILNQDSFPEINRETVLDYLTWIKCASRKYFYSINHESEPVSFGDQRQLNLPKLVELSTGYCRQSRVQYWLRKGYVAELYTIDGK